MHALLFAIQLAIGAVPVARPASDEAGQAPGVRAQLPGPSSPSLASAVAASDLVFRGVVEDIEYVLSEPTGPERVRLPYKLVTYRVEAVHKGDPALTRVTLRFIGGLDRESGRYMGASIVPEFDLDDEDILFVAGNTRRMCPLVGNRDGRLRVIRGQVYSDGGREIRLAGGELRTGRLHRLDEVLTTTVGGRVLGSRTDLPQEVAKATGPRGGAGGAEMDVAPASAAVAVEALEAVLHELPRELHRGAVFASADARVPFPGPDMSQAPPPAGDRLAAPEPSDEERALEGEAEAQRPRTKR